MLTAFDKALLNKIQENLPLVSRPYAELAKQLGVEETAVIERLNFLKKQGYIRRIGPFFDSAKLGYIGTLVAVRVREEDVPAVAAAINAYSGVTHNYERYSEGGTQYNLWFTLLSPDVGSQARVLARIEALPGVERLVSLPSGKKYKISVRFTL
ncbi:siroheme decarboxylase subunit alpha [Propionispora vibrioides]|uniref:siroheme decarboxylase n=1 Tax=Propionispora vibrioides TaxID=112903 RepID=A0A1H8Y361_9FIRM|nr:AsnC family transcriptional regulator [Propionispora vibrioides]SEP46529.1 DNA-binding transcriptional regulator, Lrp family [Propionispora vibrioides]